MEYATSLSPANLLTQFTQVGIPAFIMSTFGPSIQAKLALHPRLMKLLSILLTLYLSLSLSSSFLIGWLPRAWANLMSYGMSHVDVSSQDATLNRDITTWLATRRLIMVERFQSARSAFFLRQQQRNMGYQSTRSHRRHHSYDSNASDSYSDSSEGIVFHPKNDLQILFHNRRLFILTMSNSLRDSHASTAVPITIWCFGWSPVPIQNLLHEIQTTQRASENVLTQILTPQNGCGSNWVEQTLKRARPLDSVYLEPTAKKNLIDDMMEYLNGETRSWYQDRGIPYRRGYLFHGAPGCGKSSLALALAGHFKLNVYIISLTANGMTDYNLQYLFQALQPGCLVLLEDVDSAGLVREIGAGLSTAERKRQRRLAASGSRGGRRRVRRGRRGDYDDSYRSQDVTLSGLLNAIDGPGSPEGHILIMTTNCPEELDDALVRAGRVDVKIEFKLANRGQVRDIFYSLFKTFPKRKAAATEEGGDATSHSDKATTTSQNQPFKPENAHPDKEFNSFEIPLDEADEETNRKISELAESFASLVPEYEFSPAQLQDYILLHKNQPQRAVEEVGKFVEEHMAEKRALEMEDSDDSNWSDSDSNSGDDRERVEHEEIEERRRGKRRNRERTTVLLEPAGASASVSDEESHGPRTPGSSEPVVVVRPDGTMHPIATWQKLKEANATAALPRSPEVTAETLTHSPGVAQATAAAAANKEQVEVGGVKVEREWLDAIQKIAAQLKANELQQETSQNGSEVAGQNQKEKGEQGGESLTEGPVKEHQEEEGRFDVVESGDEFVS